MFRDLTFSDVERLEAVDETAAGFLMDEEAFRAFYDRTARGLWCYLVRVTGERQAADDLLQETFYRFLRASATYDDENHRRRSLYRIATNLARDAHRRHLRAPFSRADLEYVSTGDQTDAQEQSADVSRAMARMKPPRARNAVAGVCGRRVAS